MPIPVLASAADVLAILSFVFIILGIVPVALSSFPLLLILRGERSFWLWPCLAFLPGGVFNILSVLLVTLDYLLHGVYRGTLQEFGFAAFGWMMASPLVPLWLPAYLIVRRRRARA